MSVTKTIKKSLLLGEAHGTAANQLRKAIMFSMAAQLGLLKCHQCGEEIREVGELSIEHVVPWESAEDPRKAFFDLENIAFSHLRCNSGAANRNKVCCPNGHPLEPRAGTDRRICPECRREYMRNYMREYREKSV